MTTVVKSRTPFNYSEILESLVYLWVFFFFSCSKSPIYAHSKHLLTASWVYFQVIQMLLCFKREVQVSPVSCSLHARTGEGRMTHVPAGLGWAWVNSSDLKVQEVVAPSASIAQDCSPKATLATGCIHVVCIINLQWSMVSGHRSES